jgi:hypothetical protein
MKEIKLLSEKLNEEVIDYLKLRSLPRQIFEFVKDEIPNNQESLEFNKIISTENLEKDFDSILHRICIEMKAFEDVAFISALDDASKKENYSEDVAETVRTAFVEAKMLIDRWDQVTTTFLLNYELINDCKQAWQDTGYLKEENSKYSLFSTNILFDLNVPKHYIYAICDNCIWEIGSKRYNCGNVIWENFGFEPSGDGKYIEVFNRFSLNIDRPKQVSRIPLRKIYNQ